MAHGWSSYSVGRFAQWFVPLLAAVLVMVMVPLVGAGAAPVGEDSATEGVCTVQLDRWWGADRYATAVAVSQQTFPGGSTQVFVATGENFPDSLAVSSLAFKLGGPVLLTRKGDLPGNTANEISRLGANNIRILGGTAAVSAAVEDSLKVLGGVSRTWGADRYATAVEISKASFTNPAAVKEAYVAIGTGFADALGAAPVSAIRGAPLLLTDGATLSDVTRQEILRLDLVTVYVVGGSVSQSVVNQIAVLGPNVVVISGTDRYATAIAVSKDGFPGGADTVFFARGSTFPDALAGGVAAARQDGPILLVPETTLPVSVANELKRLNPSRIVILGGTAAVSDFVAQSLLAVLCNTPPTTTTVPGATTTLPPTTTTTLPPTTTTTLPPTTTTTLPPPPDTTKPVITVVGSSSVTVMLDSAYADAGATASDDVDGDITGSILTSDPVDTSVLGTYTVTYDVVDAAGNSAIQATRTVNVVVAVDIAQVNHFLTGYKGPDSVPANKLTVPATDPAGITYYPPTNRLFIVDSEIAEPNLSTAFAASGGNVFEVSLDGSTLYNAYDLNNLEPTGIGYDAVGDMFYVTNDDAKRLYRYAFTAGTGFTLEGSVSTALAGYNDVEGVTVDDAGNIYVIAQTKKTILVYTDDGGFTLERTMDLAGLNPGGSVPKAPEGIAYDSVSGDLFVVSGRDLPMAIFQYTTAGVLVDRFSLGSFSPLPAFGTAQHDLTAVEAPQGLTFGPGSSNGATNSLYIADGGVDNGVGTSGQTDERDGVIYEASFS